MGNTNEILNISGFGANAIESLEDLVNNLLIKNYKIKTLLLVTNQNYV